MKSDQRVIRHFPPNRARNQFSLVTATGDLDVDSASGFRAELTKTLRTGSPRVILDLRQVTFMDCAVLGVLIVASVRARTAGGWVHLIAPPPVVRRLLDLAGLGKAFPSYPTVSAASEIMFDAGLMVGGDRV